MSNDSYSLLIGYREEFTGEIEPFYVELRNQNNTEDPSEKILIWKNTQQEAENFCKEYIKNNLGVKDYYLGF